MKEYTKLDENTLQEIETKEEVQTYEYGFLESQKEWFENEIVKNQAEIARIETLLAECDKLGILRKKSLNL